MIFLTRYGAQAFILDFNYLQVARMPKEQTHLIARLLIKMIWTEPLSALPMWIQLP